MRSSGSALDTWLTRLEAFSPKEIVLGLERVEVLLERLNLPSPRFVFHIAGTNGKGSSVAMLDAVLRQSGMLVGSYTSPHLVRYNERIRVNGGEAADADIVAAFERIEAVRDDVPLTYFEYGTLAALLVFAEAGVEAAILEIGMGGRLDAVNAVEPTAGLITNVALDHCEWLGHDIETIGFEKAGIMRPGKTTVFASAEVPRSIVQHAQASGASLVVAARDYAWSGDGETWSWRGIKHQLHGLERPALVGDIQLQNAAGVLALLEAAGLIDLLHEDLINNALRDVQLDGRAQLVSMGGNWLLDVAHNPAAARTLAATLETLAPSEPMVAVIGMLNDKDVESTVTALKNSVDRWIAVTADNPRAIPAQVLGRRVAKVCDCSCLIADSLSQALDQARRVAGTDGLVLITGSFYIVGPALEALKIYSPR
jgi:dihydrofolate synthase/folylpolyglutamate synthase